MKRSRRISLVAQLLLLCGLAGLSVGMPGDVPGSPDSVPGTPLGASIQIGVGDATVSPKTGALEYSYRFVLPPGRAGMEPSLALSYSSQAALHGGVAAGWSLPIPAIERDWSLGHLAAERWTSSLAGGRELIPVVEPPMPTDALATFRAQDDSSYTRYQQLKETVSYRWRVLTLDGVLRAST